MTGVMVRQGREVSGADLDLIRDLKDVYLYPLIPDVRRAWCAC